MKHYRINGGEEWFELLDECTQTGMATVRFKERTMEIPISHLRIVARDSGPSDDVVWLKHAGLVISGSVIERLSEPAPMTVGDLWKKPQRED